MSKIKVLPVAGALAFVLMGANPTFAQDNTPNRGAGQGQNNNNNQGGRRQRGGNFDPAQFQQRMADRYRERLEITDDAEWKAIQPRIQKVLEARMALESGRRATFDRGNRQGRDRNQADSSQNQNQNQNRGTNTTDTASETLQRAISQKVGNSELKAASEQYMSARKAKEAQLEKAQEELRMVLTQRQESIALLAGLL